MSQDLIKGRRGPKKGTRYSKHKYLYIDEKGNYVYERTLGKRKGKRGRPSKQETREQKAKKRNLKVIADEQIIKEQTGKSSEELIANNMGIAVRVANDIADKYGIVRFIDENVLSPIETSDGKRVSMPVPLGIYGEILQEATIGMWKGLKLYAEQMAEGKIPKIKVSTAMYQGAKDNVIKKMLPILQGAGASIPVQHVLGKLNKLSSEEMNLTMELGRIPTVKELSEKTGYDAASIEKLRKVRRLIYMKSPDQVKYDQGSGDKIVTIFDSLKAAMDTENTYIESSIFRERNVAIKRALASLKPWEREIIVRKFGLGTEKQLVPAKYEEYSEEVPVKITSIKKKELTPAFYKEFSKVTGQAPTRKIITDIASVKEVKTGRKYEVPLKAIRNIEDIKGQGKTGLFIRRILKQTKEAEEKDRPRQPETWEQIADKVLIPHRGPKGEVVYRKTSLTAINEHHFPRIINKLRQDPNLKKVWEQLEEEDHDFIKSLTAELLKVRHRLA